MKLCNVSVVYAGERPIFKARDVSEVVALRDVSMHIGSGEKVGVIGANGAGKSTLMRVIAGVLKPNMGTVDDEGMSSALLSLNAGFDGTLSGVRNIVMHGMLMGLTRKQAAARVEAVAEMSGLGDAIHRRVSTYSTGMRARLCFSTAIDLDPDVLILDEVFSVGDKDFREKSERIMLERFESDRAILLVSHSPARLERLCDRVIWLDQGTIRAEGEAKELIPEYRKSA